MGLAQLLPGMHVRGFGNALLFAIVLAVLNALLRPLLIVFTFPLTIITLGLFLLVINTLMVLLASRFIDGFSIDGFWYGLLFSLILSLVSAILFRKDRDRTD